MFPTPEIFGIFIEQNVFSILEICLLLEQIPEICILLEQIVFPIPEICEYLTPETQRKVYNEARRDDQGRKLYRLAV